MSTHAPAAHTPELPYCRNCHHTLSVPRPRHCGHCGQETDLHPPSVREMLTEYVGHYVAFDGPFFRTLWALVLLPGHLTAAYFHGARRRYVLPLRVYLSASFLFFVGSHLLPHGHDAADAVGDIRAGQQAEPGRPVTLRVKPGHTPAGTAAEAERLAASAAHRGDAPQVTSNIDICDPHGPEGCTRAEAAAQRLADNAQRMTKAQWQAKLLALAPYGMLAMQPVFAALLLGMFAGSGRRYAEHFVFSLHTHSLWFLALLAGELMGGWPALLKCAVVVHGVAALRHVYHLGWWGACWRALALSAVYLVLLGVGLVALMAGIAATA